MLQSQSRDFWAGQRRLADITASMSGIRGTQEALELQGTIDAFLAEEVVLLRQGVATQTNVQAVYKRVPRERGDADTRQLTAP